MLDTASDSVDTKPRLPVEVCERIIEAVFDDRYRQVPTALATLSSCALVCRAWRAQAQRVRFKYVSIRDKDALYRFAELINAYPELGSYVQILTVHGYLHVPFSPAVLFPTVIGASMKNLTNLYIFGFNDTQKVAEPLPEGKKELPALPIHRYFPSLLTSISSISTLYLTHVQFPSFGDFARVLSTLSNLRELCCGHVSWAILGQVPICLAKTRGHDSRGRFLPFLKKLGCYDMDERGRHRLVSALGPSLQELQLNFPNEPQVKHAADESDELLVLDRRSFPDLRLLGLNLAPFARTDHDTIESFRKTLVSWVSTACGPDAGDSPTSERYLGLQAFNHLFERQQYVEVLRIIGPVVESEICRKRTNREKDSETEEDIDDQADPCQATLVVRDLQDRLEWEDWWWEHVAECFPTLARWNKLYVFVSGTVNPEFLWKDYASSPASDLS